MKRFLKKLSWFLVFSLVLNSLVLLVVVFLNQFAVGNCDLDDDINAVIIGDSHTMWSIDASGIENVENISLNAEGYLYTYHKLKNLLDKEPNITHVYLGFGYHNLSGYYDDYISGSLSKNFIHRYIGVIPTADLIKVILGNPSDIPVAFRNILQRGGRSGLKQQCTLYGRFPDERKMETYDSSQMEKRVLNQYYDDDGAVTNISQSNLEYLDKIVSLLRKNNIEITLLNTPLHRDYRSSIPVEYRDLYRDYINRNQLDVYELKDLTLSDSDYLPDGDHVNYDGAMLTTEQFRNYHENGYE